MSSKNDSYVIAMKQLSGRNDQCVIREQFRLVRSVEHDPRVTAIRDQQKPLRLSYVTN
jgi:hypothetical protein